MHIPTNYNSRQVPTLPCALILHEQQENIADWEKVLNPGVAEVVRGRMHLCTNLPSPCGEGSVHAKSHQLSQSRFPLLKEVGGEENGGK